MNLYYDSTDHKEYAENICNQINGCIVSGFFYDISKDDLDSIYLRVTDHGLILCNGEMELCCDFTNMMKRIEKHSIHQELLIKASKSTLNKIKNNDEKPVLIDATAGFGEDSFLFAAAGFEVIMFEKDSVIAALLKDGLKRASLYPSLTDIVNRMHLIVADSITALTSELLDHLIWNLINYDAFCKNDIMEQNNRNYRAEINQNISTNYKHANLIYLDPMFPERTKSGLVKKKFQLLHHLEKPCEDEEALLNSALEYHPEKIIIKRPLKGPVLAGRKPSYSLSGKAIRYDCIVL